MAGPRLNELDLYESFGEGYSVSVVPRSMRIINPRPPDAAVKPGTQTEEQAKLSRAEGQAPESGMIPQVWAFLKSPAGMIIGGFVGLVLLRKFWK